MTFKEYLTEAAKCFIANKRTHRRGQAYWNTLELHRKDLADKIRATKIDPYYRDERVPDFIDYLKDKWNQ